MCKNGKMRIDELLREYFDGNLPKDLDETLQGWIVSNDHSKEKNLALFHLFFDEVKAANEPDKNTEKSLEEIKLLLKLPEAREKRHRKSTTSNKRRILRAIITSAAVFVLSISAAWYFNRNTEQQQIAEITINAGSSVRTIVLPDGSTVELQANAKLTYDDKFSAGRCVYLDGEALFTVSAFIGENGDSIPFSVTTDNITVNVHGTVFKIADFSEGDESIVALYEGSVSVAADETTINLEHGEECNYHKNSKEASVALIPAEDMAAHGYLPLLRFEDSTLGNLITSLATNYGVEFVLPEDVDLSRGRFSGDFQQEDLRSTLSILTKSNMTHSFTLTDDKVFVNRK